LNHAVAVLPGRKPTAALPTPRHGLLTARRLTAVVARARFRSGYLEMPEIVVMVMKESGVSEEEAKALAEKQLVVMDTDGDRKITFNEYLKCLAA
jgi:hypothetical protein